MAAERESTIEIVDLSKVPLDASEGVIHTEIDRWLEHVWHLRAHNPRGSDIQDLTAWEPPGRAPRQRAPLPYSDHYWRENNLEREINDVFYASWKWILQALNSKKHRKLVFEILLLEFVKHKIVNPSTVGRPLLFRLDPLLTDVLREKMTERRYYDLFVDLVTDDKTLDEWTNDPDKTRDVLLTWLAAEGQRRHNESTRRLFLILFKNSTPAIKVVSLWLCEVIFQRHDSVTEETLVDGKPTGLDVEIIRAAWECLKSLMGTKEFYEVINRYGTQASKISYSLYHILSTLLRTSDYFDYAWLAIEEIFKTAESYPVESNLYGRALVNVLIEELAKGTVKNAIVLAKLYLPTANEDNTLDLSPLLEHRRNLLENQRSMWFTYSAFRVFEYLIENIEDRALAEQYDGASRVKLIVLENAATLLKNQLERFQRSRQVVAVLGWFSQHLDNFTNFSAQLYETALKFRDHNIVLVALENVESILRERRKETAEEYGVMKQLFVLSSPPLIQEPTSSLSRPRLIQDQIKVLARRILDVYVAGKPGWPEFLWLFVVASPREYDLEVREAALRRFIDDIGTEDHVLIKSLDEAKREFIAFRANDINEYQRTRELFRDLHQAIVNKEIPVDTEALPRQRSAPGGLQQAAASSSSSSSSAPVPRQFSGPAIMGGGRRRRPVEPAATERRGDKRPAEPTSESVVSKGDDRDAKRQKEQIRALLVAVKIGNQSLVRSLFQENAALRNVRTGTGKSLAQYASANGQHDLLSLVS